MIILDTSVISELVRTEADPSVVSWVDQHSFAEICVTSVTVAELLAGIAVLPAGRRRSQLSAAVSHVLESEFGEHILPFDDSAAIAFAQLAASRKRAGITIGVPDTAIAAIAISVGAQTLVTRNIADFPDAAFEVVNPWSD